MTWLVEYAGVLTTRRKVKPDGRTGFEAVRGKRHLCQSAGLARRSCTYRLRRYPTGSLTTGCT
eukprot:1415713-Heterocapsa_arctica.AAC.1